MDKTDNLPMVEYEKQQSKEEQLHDEEQEGVEETEQQIDLDHIFEDNKV